MKLVEIMSLEDAPKWVQEVVVGTALGLLEGPCTVTVVNGNFASLYDGEFTYTADRLKGMVY
ncbi:hypothetical protein [Streptomyces sp. NPDC090080]|uniref:hypothetical protein n=1 Tax=Streptomyces sp. NPDC090080 TaxID=3365939 RepID=UPI00380DAAE6